MGRITLVKSLALFSIGFPFSGITRHPPPCFFIKELEKVTFDFIWQSYQDKVKRSVLINDIQKGGLKAVHIKSFINCLKCTWVLRYCVNPNYGVMEIIF